VINGEPVAAVNRRVIVIWMEAGCVEEGSVAAVQAGKGSVNKVSHIGTVTVALDEQLSLVQDWAEKALKHDGESMSENDVYEIIGEQVVATQQAPLADVRTVELDIFRGYVVNRKKDKVFAHKRPSSFP
jgi:hypothetical protein